MIKKKNNNKHGLIFILHDQIKLEQIIKFHPYKIIWLANFSEEVI